MGGLGLVNWGLGLKPQNQFKQLVTYSEIANIFRQI